MDRIGVAATLLAISSPGIHFGDDSAAIRLARTLNEEIAALVRERPIPLWACSPALPLPALDEALAELDHAFDVLGADGVSLLTNANGVYLGEPG